jgi:predicted O-methyltransferase YrrM
VSAQQVKEVIERLLRDGAVIARADGSRHEIFPVAIPSEEGEAVRDWVRREGASRTIEVGLAYGISALHICEGLIANGHSDARHLTIDPYQITGASSCGLQVLDEAGLSSIVEHHEERSQIALPRFLSEGRTFDFAFVDGNHRFDAVFVDLYYLEKLIRPGGIVILDDHQLPGVARAASFFLTNLGWQLEEVSVSDPLHNWAVLRTSLTPDERPFSYFMDF